MFWAVFVGKWKMTGRLGRKRGGCDNYERRARWNKKCPPGTAFFAMSGLPGHLLSLSCRGAGTSESVYRLDFSTVEIDFCKFKYLTPASAALRALDYEIPAGLAAVKIYILDFRIV